MLIKFSEIWLRQWVNPIINRDNLSKQLTMLGIEVEKIIPITPFRFKNVISGQIIDFKIINKYQKKIIVYKVNIGKKYITIISNIKIPKNFKVAISNSKSILPKNKQNNTFDKKIKNKISEGYFCTYSQLSINIESNDILLLPQNTPLGIDIYKYLNLNDFIFHVNITPNRSDCLSIIGIAREIAAINKIFISWPKIDPVLIKHQNIFLVKIKENDLCPIFLSRIIQNVIINQQTPLWIKEKLERSGIKCQNIINDIINYVLLEIGQPIYIYDVDKINSYIEIRMSNQKELFEISKNKFIELDDKTLVIADKEKILSIAGVLKNFVVKINKNTKNIIINCPLFKPKTIIKQIYRHKLFNDFGYRYERGVDFKIQYKAIEYITSIIIKVCGGKAGPIINYPYDLKTKKILKKFSKTIFLRKKKIEHILGYKLKTNIKSNLENIGFKIIDINSLGFLIEVPSWRYDIIIEEDIIEEIFRIYGYNNINRLKLKSKINFINNKKNILNLKKINQILINEGYQEVINYSFVNSNIQSNLYPKKKFVTLKNPISKDMSLMRRSMITGLITTAIYNQNRQQETIRIFEQGICFIPDKKSEFGIRQEFILSALISGKKNNHSWFFNHKEKNQFFDFYDIKGDLELVLSDFKNIEFCSTKKIYFLHPGQSAYIYINKIKVGIIGLLHPQVLNKFNIKSQIFIFEIMYNRIKNISNNNDIIHSISKYPINYRDISFFVKKEIPLKYLIKEFEIFFKKNKLFLFSVNVFDVYNDHNFQKKYKSISLRINMQFSNRTLTEKEMSEILTSCLKEIKSRFNILMRDK